MPSQNRADRPTQDNGHGSRQLACCHVGYLGTGDQSRKMPFDYGGVAWKPHSGDGIWPRPQTEAKEASKNNQAGKLKSTTSCRQVSQEIKYEGNVKVQRESTNYRDGIQL